MRPSLRLALAFVATLLAAAPSRAQLGGGNVPEARELIQVSVAPVTIASGSHGEARVTIRVREGWHINANPPSLDYMIPTEVSLVATGGITAAKPVYPKAREQKLSFEEKPLLVYDGEVEVRVPLVAVAGTSTGRVKLPGTLGFQSCNDQVCLAPAEVPFEVVVTVGPPVPGQTNARPPVDGGANAPAPTDTGASDVTPPQGKGFVTEPPPSGSAAGPGLPENPLARFFWLFVIGLALNLTPCVYPMLGVTVSIFGARRAAPPMQVFGLALVYVLGMAAMYSTLGVVAALTGGLFGGALQSPIVSFAIGALLAAMAFSMFGFYEFQPPTWVMERVGGANTTSVAGIFLSGLVVGVIAAPCIGPPVVALLAVVGAKGDPWFGFTSFFTLAMGLGAPYLVLGTFSNLMQSLPRSGDWMVWVKKVFGVIMLALGTFYISLAIAPRVSTWIVPASLIAGGLYLGFIDRTAGAKPAFRLLRRIVGVAGIVAGITIVATTPRGGVVFEAFAEPALAETLAGGKPAMLDFTADWCAPCHELERFTFSDSRVKDATKPFRAFRVDLTKYQSAEAKRLRSQFGVSGVPTVVFLTPDGREVHGARVVGFIPPEQFIERVRIAEAAGERAAAQ
jgi:thiol:disulfide interchange protein DsbD